MFPEHRLICSVWDSFTSLQKCYQGISVAEGCRQTPHQLSPSCGQRGASRMRQSPSARTTSYCYTRGQRRHYRRPPAKDVLHPVPAHSRGEKFKVCLYTKQVNCPLINWLYLLTQSLRLMSARTWFLVGNSYRGGANNRSEMVEPNPNK